MFPKRKRSRRHLSVIAVFFNMQRVARRTLQSLSRKYQGLDPDSAYEVHVIDNCSQEPISPELIRSCGEEFRYHFAESETPSPCRAINQFVERAQYENVMVLIDGARILSPGIVRLSLAMLDALPHPFVYTLGMHIGSKPQNYLVNEGYNQAMEEELLRSSNWENNPYSLFSISSPALSSKRGFFSKLSESNCFALRKKDFIEAGEYETKFQSPGGGLCNLELFNRLNICDWIQPVMLLGEATFHQFHGGVATNVPMSQHPWQAMQQEYAKIMGEPWRNKFRPPIYFGSFRGECATLYNAAAGDEPD